MPTYQYQCTDCGEALEIHQSFSDNSLTQCPACRGTLRKVFNAVGVVFKGSGFYRNDSRPDSSTSSTKPASTPAASTSATSTPATTSAPAASASDS